MHKRALLQHFDEGPVTATFTRRLLTVADRSLQRAGMSLSIQYFPIFRFAEICFSVAWKW